MLSLGISYSRKSEGYNWSVVVGNHHLCILLFRDVVREMGGRSVDVSGCRTNVEQKGGMSKMFVRWKLDVCALSETQLKGKGEVMIGEIVGRASVPSRCSREDEGRGDDILSRLLLRCVVEWKEVSSRLM